MKTWLQSGAAVGHDQAWEPYEKALIKHAEKVARPGNTVDIIGTEVMTTGIDRSRYIETLNSLQVINSAINAEKRGYDIFALTSMLDLGFYSLREVVNIPVALSLETSCHVACLLAPKFSLLGYNNISIQRLTSHIKQYGLQDRMIPGRSFPASLDTLQEGFNDPGPILEGASRAAKKAGANGADMLLPTCAILNMILVVNGIREIEGIPVLDTVGTIIKMAEFLVDLADIGIERINHGMYARLPKDELLNIRKLYKIE